MSDARRVTAVAGLAAAILFGAGNALWAFSQPKAGASAGEVASFYSDHHDGIVVGGSLSLISIAVFVVFASGLRSMLREVSGDEVLANTAFGGTMLLLAAGLGAESINMAAALRADDGSLSPELGRALFETSYVFGYTAAGVGVGVVLIAAAAVALRSRALLPRWLALLVIVFGLACLTPLIRYLLGPAMLLLAVYSATLLRRPSRGAED